MGRQMKSLDDFMSAFGVTGADGADISDDERSAFTNPENVAYWGNMPTEDKELAALSLGYDNFAAMKDDLDRAGRGYQIRNQVEGWGANNEFQPADFAWSSIKGLTLPRVKDAQLAGREPTWQDWVGDAAELGLNVVPGVGLVTKSGKLVARVPGISKVAGTAFGSMVEQGVPLVAEQFAVPVATQLMDSQLLYNPEALGTEASALDPRSQFDWKAVGLQSAGIGGAKAAVKGGAMVAKNALEQGFGNDVGGSVFRNAVKNFETIGEKSDDLIKRRQAMLDRKAKIAKKRENVTLADDRDIGATSSSVDDLINATNFRILTSEADRIAKSNKARSAYKRAVSGEEAAEAMVNSPFGISTPELEARWRDAVKAQKNAKTSVEADYRSANEDSPYLSLLIMDDGRVVPRDYVTFDGELKYPGADYSFKPTKKLSPLEYKYDDFYNRLLDDNANSAAVRWTFIPNEAIDADKVVARNPAVLEQIQKDDLLRRKLDGATSTIENLRDTGANVAFNAMAREGLANNSSINDLEKKRADAIWNRTIKQLRPLTANSELPIETRRKNASAIMNVMQNGLDGVPEEEFVKNPRLYHIIADRLGVKGWKHPSEASNPMPTTSYSSAY